MNDRLKLPDRSAMASIKISGGVLSQCGAANGAEQLQLRYRCLGTYSSVTTLIPGNSRRLQLVLNSACYRCSRKIYLVKMSLTRIFQPQGHVLPFGTAFALHEFCNASLSLIRWLYLPEKINLSCSTGSLYHQLFLCLMFLVWLTIFVSNR